MLLKSELSYMDMVAVRLYLIRIFTDTENEHDYHRAGHKAQTCPKICQVAADIFEF